MKADGIEDWPIVLKSTSFKIPITVERSLIDAESQLSDLLPDHLEFNFNLAI